MLAIQIRAHGGLDALDLVSIPTPDPAPGQVRIRVEASGVNFIDIYHRTGFYKVDLPFVPGQEVVGTVDALGDGVHNLLLGERVAVIGGVGGYANFSLAPAHRCVRVPDALEPDRAAALLLQGMTAQFLTTSTFPLQPGQTVVVHSAAGGTGGLLCAFARHLGARVLGTVSSASKVNAALAAGAHEVVVRTGDWVGALLDHNNGQGVDVVYDGVGQDTFDASLSLLRPRGGLALFGQSSGPVPPFDPLRLSAAAGGRGGSLFLTRPSLFHYIATEAELHARAQQVFGLAVGGVLPVRIGAAFELRRAAEAQELLESGRSQGKIVLLPE